MACCRFTSPRKIKNRTKTIIFLLVWVLCFQVIVFLSLHRVASLEKSFPSSRRASVSIKYGEKSRGKYVPTEERTTAKSTRNVNPPLNTTLTNISSQVELYSLQADHFFVVHSHSESGEEPSSPIKYVVVFPNKLPQTDLSSLDTSDLQSVLELGELLELMPELDGATSLPLSMKEQAQVLLKGNTPESNAGLLGLFSRSWCQFARRDWSIQIRNTGKVDSKAFGNVLQISGNHSTVVPGNKNYIFQLCNIVRGAFVIRKEKFMQIKHWRSRFGRLGILDFFLRSEGNFKIAKFGNVFLSDSRHILDRGEKQGASDFPEYASFGNEHGILRIIQEDRIEWTVCVARGSSCKEEQYSPPKTLPKIGLPICCSVVLDRMLNDFVQVCVKLGIRHLIIYGTLLGAVRSNAIIPWTHDIDIALHKDDYNNETFFSALEKHFDGRYYVGNSFMDTPRMVPLIPAYIEVNTAPFYDGLNDLQGDRFFSQVINNSVEGLLPFNNFWRERGYLDFYRAPGIWWNGSSTITINGFKYITIRDIKYELQNWYGADYMKPVNAGESWNGLSDIGS